MNDSKVKQGLAWNKLTSQRDKLKHALSELMKFRIVYSSLNHRWACDHYRSLTCDCGFMAAVEAAAKVLEEVKG